MGGIGCCLPRNVYVAPQCNGEIVIWCETELINWFALVKASGDTGPKQRRTLGEHVHAARWPYGLVWMLENMSGSDKKSPRDIISENAELFLDEG